MHQDLRNQVAVVTGGTRGIGAAIARALLGCGASVVICGRSAQSIEEALANFGGLGRAEGRPCDVGRLEEVKTLFQFVAQTFGRLDILINNAGVGGLRPIDEMPPEQWRQIIDTNLSGVFYCSREAIPRMKKSGGGFIINIGSLAGKHAFAGGVAYNASKFGLAGLSEAMMLDLRDDDIRVSSIMPGSVDTKFGGPRTPAAGWKIAPEQVADTVIHLLTMPQRSLVSRVEMRPSRTAKKPLKK